MENKRVKVMSVFGARPEAIKICPLMLELQKAAEIQSVVCLTGQHRQMLDQGMEVFDVRGDYDLEIMLPKAEEVETVRVVGVEEENISESTRTLLTKREKYDQMAHVVNPRWSRFGTDRETLASYV